MAPTASLLLVLLLQTTHPEAEGAAAETRPWETRLAATIPSEYAPDADFRFSPDGQRLAYVAVDGKGKSVVVIDGDAEKGRDYVNAPVFSADGKHVAWSSGDRAGKKAEKWYAYLDGKKQKMYSWVGPVVMDASGKKIAYWAGKGVKIARDGWYSGGDYFVVYGKKKLGKTNGQPEWAPALSPDGKKVAWSTVEGNYKVFLGKEEFGPYRWVSHMAWSTDGKHLAWQAAKVVEMGMSFTGPMGGDPSGAGGNPQGGMPQMKGFLCLDGELLEHDFDSVAAPALGPKGKHLAYVAQEKEQVLVVHDDRAWESRWDQLGTPVLDPKGKRVAVIANTGMEAGIAGMPMLNTLWLDGVDFGEWDAQSGTMKTQEPEGECWLVVDDQKIGKPYLRALFPIWGPNGEHVAFRALVEGGWKLVVDEQESDTFDAVGVPMFRADGKVVGFGARKGAEIWWQVLPTES